jgi:DNA-binding transcriptional MerR regulator
MSPVSADLTIEQLAAATGMTVRNIRAHQARGLLSPPEVRLRVGYYGPEHVAQLKLIQDLQEDGFNLAGIKRLVDDDQATALRVGRLRRTLTASGRAQSPETMTVDELGRSQALLDVAGQMVARGVSLDGTLAVCDQAELHCDAISAAFVALLRHEVWAPFQAAGLPTERRAEIEDSIELLRPLATDALVAIFDRRMRAQIDAAFAGLGGRAH